MKKNVFIIGDSYSTFKGYIPEIYAAYYSEEGRPETDVRKVEQTWWHQVFEKKGLNLVLNNSWSGSTIGHTRYNGVDCSKTSSFIFRLRQLIENRFFEENEIHTAFMFGGTNDSWCDAPLGEPKFGDWEERDLFSVLPAICYTLYLMRQTMPHANIYCPINTDLKPEIVACMKAACEQYNITPITFDKIDKNADHPTIQGMKDIADGVMNVLNNQ